MKCQAMDIEMRRQKEFEECRLRYSKVLGKAWGDESKRKAAEDKAKRELKTKTTDILPSLFQSQFKVTSPRSPKSQRRGSLASQTEIQKQQTAEVSFPASLLFSMVLYFFWMVETYLWVFSSANDIEMLFEWNTPIEPCVIVLSCHVEMREGKPPMNIIYKRATAN